jgi:hypothetical protein
MPSNEVLIGAVLLAVAMAIVLRIEIGTRSQAWRRIAEERRWNWERRIESLNDPSDR